MSRYESSLRDTLSRRSTQRSYIRPSAPYGVPLPSVQGPMIDMGILKSNCQKTNQDLVRITATSKHSSPSTTGLKATISIDRSAFIAAGTVVGSVHIECTNPQRLRIGAIKVEVIGFEEIAVGKEPYRRLFLWNLQHIQDALARPDIRPSDIVVAGSYDVHGMWQSRKGHFDLRFAVPLEKINEVESQPLSKDWSVSCFPLRGSIPSSFWSKNFGGVKYFVRATIEYKRIKGVMADTTTDMTPLHLEVYREIQVLETASRAQILDIYQDTFPVDSPLAAETKGPVSGPKLFGFGKKGQLWIKAFLRNTVGSADEGFKLETASWVSGSDNIITLDMANVSERNIVEIKASLIRKLKTFTFNQQVANALEVGQLVDKNQIETNIIPLQYDERVESTKIYRIKKYEKECKGKNFGSSKLILPEWREKTASEEPGTFKSVTRIEYENWAGLDKGQGTKREISLYVPHNSRTIRDASLIDVSYTVEVTVKPKGSVAIRLEMPILILSPQSFIKREAGLEPTIVQRDGSVLQSSTFQAAMAAPAAAPAFSAEDFIQSSSLASTPADGPTRIGTPVDPMSQQSPLRIPTPGYTTNSVNYRRQAINNSGNNSGMYNSMPNQIHNISNLSAAYNGASVYGSTGNVQLQNGAYSSNNRGAIRAPIPKEFVQAQAPIDIQRLQQQQQQQRQQQQQYSPVISASSSPSQSPRQSQTIPGSNSLLGQHHVSASNASYGTGNYMTTANNTQTIPKSSVKTYIQRNLMGQANAAQPVAAGGSPPAGANSGYRGILNRYDAGDSGFDISDSAPSALY